MNDDKQHLDLTQSRPWATRVQPEYQLKFTKQVSIPKVSRPNIDFTLLQTAGVYQVPTNALIFDNTGVYNPDYGWIYTVKISYANYKAMWESRYIDDGYGLIDNPDRWFVELFPSRTITGSIYNMNNTDALSISADFTSDIFARLQMPARGSYEDSKVFYNQCVGPDLDKQFFTTTLAITQHADDINGVENVYKLETKFIPLSMVGENLTSSVDNVPCLIDHINVFANIDLVNLISQNDLSDFVCAPGVYRNSAMADGLLLMYLKPNE